MMSETLESVATEVDQRQLAEQLLAQAKEQGVELVGPNGLLNQLTKNVLETALDAEMAEHLGYDKHDPARRGTGNSRNGTRAKTVFTEIGPVEIEVPRDTNSSFEPQTSRSASAACRASTRSCCRSVWDLAIVQTCVIHLLRNTFRYASRRQGHPPGLHRTQRGSGQGTLR